MIKPPGRAPTRLEQIQLSEMLKGKTGLGIFEEVIVHHITENTPYKLQLEVERRFTTYFRNKHTCIKFERLYL